MPSRRSAHRSDHLGNHFAGANHFDPVADADVLLRDDFVVVQRGAGDRHAAELDRLEHGVRRERTGAPDVDAGCRAAA